MTPLQHLDEKIMQFLKIANVMMRKTGNGSDYHARNYSVVPLGPRSGLIQWVGGALPVYSILKKRQQRQQQLDPKGPYTYDVRKVVGFLYPSTISRV